MLVPISFHGKIELKIELFKQIGKGNDLKFNIYILEEPDSTLVDKSKVQDICFLCLAPSAHLSTNQSTAQQHRL
jgi:hypothetical protein